MSAKASSPLFRATLAGDGEDSESGADGPQASLAGDGSDESIRPTDATTDGVAEDGEHILVAPIEREATDRDSVAPLKLDSPPSRRHDADADAGDKENESPLGHEDRTLGEIDALGLDKSMVIRSSGGGAKKSKRSVLWLGCSPSSRTLRSTQADISTFRCLVNSGPRSSTWRTSTLTRTSSRLSARRRGVVISCRNFLRVAFPSHPPSPLASSSFSRVFNS